MESPEQTALPEPPGGILIWLIMLLELVTFLASLVVFAWIRRQNIALFESGRMSLNPPLATVNTAVLLSSGYFAARSILLLRKNKPASSSRNFLMASLLGLVFVAIKIVEYSSKLQQGYDLSYDTFFSFYWLLTGFHLVHVLVGIGLLLGMALALHRIRTTDINQESLDAAAAVAVFWHMCDLIWVMVFPVLYLLH